MGGDALHHKASCIRGKSLLLLVDATRGDVDGRVGGEILHHKMATLQEETLCCKIAMSLDYIAGRHYWGKHQAMKWQHYMGRCCRQTTWGETSCLKMATSLDEKLQTDIVQERHCSVWDGKGAG